MKKVIWIGPERIVPGLGKLTQGSEREMQDAQADSYVAQGLVEYAAKPTSTKKLKLED